MRAVRQPTLSGTQTSFPFLFGGGQFDPTGYYGAYSPRLMHSLSGGAVPYTGQGAAVEFGSMSGVPPRAMGASGRPVTRGLAVAAARVRREDDGLRPGECCADELDSADSGQAPGDPTVNVVSSVLNIAVPGLGDLFSLAFGDLFGGGGSQTIAVHIRPEVPPFQQAGYSAGLNVTQARPPVLASANNGLGPNPPDSSESTWVESGGFSVSLINVVGGWDSRSGFFVNALVGASVGGQFYLQWTRVGPAGVPIGTVNAGMPVFNLSAGLGLSRGLSGSLFVSSVSANLGASLGLPVGFETPPILGK